MKTILDVLNLTDLKDDPSVLSDLIDDEATKCKNAGDLLGTGEWLTSKLLYSHQDQMEETLSKVIALWASPVELRMFPSNIGSHKAGIAGVGPKQGFAIMGESYKKNSKRRLRTAFLPPR